MDGLDRWSCAEISLNLLEPHGAIIVDDSERNCGPIPGCGFIDLYRKDGFSRIDGIYHCLGDRSRVRALNGSRAGMLRTRSYSMSGCFGGRTNEVQNTVARYNSIPKPSALFVFIDEDEDSIDDAHFLTWPQPDDRWVNLPAGRHGQTGVLSFADGRGERWKWRHGKEFKHKQGYWKKAENAADLADLRRLQAATLPVEQYHRQP